MGNAFREETIGHVRRLTLCRPDRDDTITPVREAVRECDRPFGDYGERGR